MSEHNEHPTPGTVAPATLRKAGCGVRYNEDELREGIDFSGAAQLRPDLDEEADHPIAGAPAEPHPKDRSAETP